MRKVLPIMCLILMVCATMVLEGSEKESSPLVGRASALSLLNNGGFEQELSQGWGTGQYAAGKDLWWNSNKCDSFIQRDAHLPHQGTYSLHLLNRTAKAPNTFGTTQQQVSIEPNRSYKITLWARGSNLAMQNAVTIVVDEAWNVRPIGLPKGTFGWTKLSGVFSLPTNKAEFRILMEGPGEAWLDDIQLELVPQVNTNLTDPTDDNALGEEDSDTPDTLDLDSAGERLDTPGQGPGSAMSEGSGDFFAEFKRNEGDGPGFDGLEHTGSPGGIPASIESDPEAPRGQEARKKLQVTVSPKATKAPVLTWVDFRSVVSGGTGPYTFAWTASEVAQQGAKENVRFRWRQKGKKVVTLTVTDSSNPPVQAHDAASVDVDAGKKEHLKPRLSIGSVVLAPSVVAPGGTVKVNAIFHVANCPGSAVVFEATFAMETSSGGSIARKTFRFRCNLKDGVAHKNVWVQFPTRTDAKCGPIRAAVKLQGMNMLAKKMGFGEIRQKVERHEDSGPAAGSAEIIRYWKGIQITKMPDNTTVESPSNLMTCHRKATDEHYLKDVKSGEIFGRGKSKYQYSFKNGNHHLTILEKSKGGVVQNVTLDFFETEDTLSGKGSAAVQTPDERTGKLVMQTFTFTYHLKRDKSR